MNEGVPDCPDCGGKGMCDKHNVDYLEWVYNTAKNEYEAALKEYKIKLEKSIAEREQSELTACKE